MNDLSMVICPYCYQGVELYVDPETSGNYVEDCAICCRPWRVKVSRDEEQGLSVQVARDQ